MLNRYLKSWWPILVLIAAVLSLFGPALLGPTRVLFPTFSPFSDLMVIHWPKAHLMAGSWQAGQGLPYWTPLILSGMPLAANQLAMLFYPPAWLFLVLPVEPVFNLLFVFHLLLGGVGLYVLLTRVHGLGRPAGLLGGLTFALNGKWLAHAAGGHVSLVGAIGWMPWVLVGLHLMLMAGEQGRTFSDKKLWLGALLAAVALAMQITTHTLLLLYSAYLLAAAVIWYFAVILAGPGRHAQSATHSRLSRAALLRRLGLPLLAVPLGAALLGAGQLLPLLEMAQYSNRALSPGEAAQFSLAPAQLLLGLLLPSTRGGHEYVIYLGLVPLLLAPLGLSRSQHWTWFYGLLAVFSLLFALGPYTPVHGLFYAFAPGFSWVRTPARMLFVGALAVASLTGFGAERLVLAGGSPGVRRWQTRLLAAAGLLAVLLGLGLALGFGQVNRAGLTLTLLVPLAAGVILLRVQRLLPATVALGLVGLALYLDLASFDLAMMRFVPRAEALAPGRPTAEYLAQKQAEAGEPFRVYSPSYSLPMQTAAAAGLALADGVEPVHLAAYDRYMAQAGGYDSPGFSVTVPYFGDQPLETALTRARPELKLLGLLNVAYLVSAFPMPWPGLTLEAERDGTFIYRNEQALPRARVVHRTVPVEADWLAQLAGLPNPANVAAVEHGPALNGDAASPARVTRATANLLTVETEITAPGWLVLSEIWYPGWQATVNGQTRPLERVNGLFRGVYLDEPGDYRVTLEYRPQSVTWGNRLAVITAGAVSAAALITLSRRIIIRPGA